jgi:DNA-binding GntR family transcriptional regulator
VNDDQREAMPPYQRIAADLRARIESGDLAPGDMLPSLARITQEYGVAKGTAVKALAVLRTEGLTRTVPGWGTFVVLGNERRGPE